MEDMDEQNKIKKREDSSDSEDDQDNTTHSMVTGKNLQNQAREAVNREQARGHQISYKKPEFARKPLVEANDRGHQVTVTNKPAFAGKPVVDANDFDVHPDPMGMFPRKTSSSEIDDNECTGECLKYKYTADHLKKHIKSI